MTDQFELSMQQLGMWIEPSDDDLLFCSWTFLGICRRFNVMYVDLNIKHLYYRVQ